MQFFSSIFSLYLPVFLINSSFVVLYNSELDAAVMRAITSLLANLPLQPEDIETDIVEAKSQLFLK